MDPFFFIRCDGRFVRIEISEIRYLESVKNYVRIVTVKSNYLVLMSMRQLEKELPQDQFCHVHRSFIVSLRHICAFDHDAVYMNSVTIPVSRVFRYALQSKVRVLLSNTRCRNSFEGDNGLEKIDNTSRETL